MKHIKTVAEYMKKHAWEHGLDGDKMYVLGLLHDIGYICRKPNHAKNGADLLRQMGFSEEYCYAVQNHSCNLKNTSVITPELLLLLRADLQVNHKGELVGYKSRLASIKEKYGEDSIVYKNVIGTIEELKKMNL